MLNKGHDIIIFADDVTKKILSGDSNYIVDVFMWPKFGNCSISMREVHNLNFIKIWPEKRLFWGVSWFKFNNLGLALGTSLKFYTIVAKGLKLKVRNFWGLIPMFVEVTGEKVVGEAFPPPQSWIGLNLLIISTLIREINH